jgi:hypothetical protein
VIDRPINLKNFKIVKSRYKFLFYITYYLLLINIIVKIIASIIFEAEKYIKLSLPYIKFLYLKRIKRQSRILSLALNREKLLIIKQTLYK